MELVIKAKEGSQDAKMELIRLYTPLIASSVKKYTVGKESREDLRQEATLAFLEAIDRFNPERGKFGAFAGKYIFGRLKNYFTRNLRRTKLPTEYVEGPAESFDYNKLHDAVMKLPIINRDIIMSKLGFWDTPVPLETKYGISKARVSQILKDSVALLRKGVK